MNEIIYKKENNQFITPLKREFVITHMLGYLDEEKIDMNDEDMYLLGYLDASQWVDAKVVLDEEYHPALRELSLLVDERYETNFHSNLM